VGLIVHVFATYPFRGDVVVLIGERRELCSEDDRKDGMSRNKAIETAADHCGYSPQRPTTSGISGKGERVRGYPLARYPTEGELSLVYPG
jgi:hypothetical protein